MSDLNTIQRLRLLTANVLVAVVAGGRIFAGGKLLLESAP
jgi:hypothetical protein